MLPYFLLIMLFFSGKVSAGSLSYRSSMGEKCHQDFFPCRLSLACAPWAFRCDGFVDCPDKTDEENCSLDELRMYSSSLSNGATEHPSRKQQDPSRESQSEPQQVSYYSTSTGYPHVEQSISQEEHSEMVVWQSSTVVLSLLCALLSILSLVLLCRNVHVYCAFGFHAIPHGKAHLVSKDESIIELL